MEILRQGCLDKGFTEAELSGRRVKKWRKQDKSKIKTRNSVCLQVESWPQAWSACGSGAEITSLCSPSQAGTSIPLPVRPRPPAIEEGRRKEESPKGLHRPPFLAGFRDWGGEQDSGGYQNANDWNLIFDSGLSLSLSPLRYSASTSDSTCQKLTSCIPSRPAPSPHLGEMWGSPITVPVPHSHS